MVVLGHYDEICMFLQTNCMLILKTYFNAKYFKIGSKTYISIIKIICRLNLYRPYTAL